MQFEALESVCVKYLCSQLQRISDTMLLRIAKLADYLGLGSLCETAARMLVQLPWDEHSSSLSAIARLAYFHNSSGRLDALLHHPRRGACCELQLLEMLETAGVHDDRVASLIKVELMKQAELQMLLDTLTTGGHAAKRSAVTLLHKAV